MLYTKIREQVTTLSALGEQLPIIYKMSFDMVWLGHASDLLEIELKSTKKELGWLYTKSSIVVFEWQGSLMEIWLSELKEYAETVLSEKKFLAVGQPPEAGKISKADASGRIVGYVDTLEVARRSKLIKES